ncbi:hypothetical protein [Streptomyces sp. NPDC101393]|uniref:hypothetical protein n=1 Tax=Streptomyces sp. NPDC101393 TaxID=3366141 RepID=UPI0037F1C67C
MPTAAAIARTAAWRAPAPEKVDARFVPRVAPQAGREPAYPDGSGTVGALDFLRAFLGQGPKTRAECNYWSKKIHISIRSVERAKKTLKLKSSKTHGGEANWELG